MRLTPNNFLSQIKNLVTGGGVGQFAASTTFGDILPDGGFKNDYFLRPTEWWSGPATVATGGSTVGSTTVNVTYPQPSLVNTSGGLFLEWSAGNTSAASTSYCIRRAYDQESDYFNLRAFGMKAGAGTDAPHFVVTASTLALGTSTLTALTQISSTSTAIGSVLTVEEFNFSANGLVRDDVIVLTVAADGKNSTAGQELQFYGLEVVTASCLVAFGATTSTAYGSAGYNLDALGNPLR